MIGPKRIERLAFTSTYSPWCIEVLSQGQWRLAANLFPDKEFAVYLNELKSYTLRVKEATFRLYNRATDEVIMGDIL